MANLQSLLAEQDTAQQRLADHRAQLDAQRRKSIPDRIEQARLRERVDEGERELKAVVDDVSFERARLASSEYRTARDAVRAKRDAALKTHNTTITSGWASIESKMRALIAEAAALSQIANQTAAELADVAWAHHLDTDRASTASGFVVDAAMGGGHAHAVALLLEDFVKALPRAVAPRLASQFGIEIHVRSAVDPSSTLAQASATAQRLLVERCSPWMSDPQPEQVAA